VGGDEKSGDGEEHIDADESAAEPIRPQVIENDSENGKGAKTLNLRA
jgi:hypothetical protein